MKFVKTDQAGYERDPVSNAVSVTDNSAREEYRYKIRTRKDIDELKTKVAFLEQCCREKTLELESIRQSCMVLEDVRNDLQMLKNQFVQKG